MAAVDDDSWLSSDVSTDYVCAQNKCPFHVTFKRPLEFENSPLGVAIPKFKRKGKTSKGLMSVPPLTSSTRCEWLSPHSTADFKCSGPRSSRRLRARGSRAKCGAGTARQRDHVHTERKENKGKVRMKQNQDGGTCDVMSKPAYCELEIRARGEPRDTNDHAHVAKTKHFIWQKRLQHHSPPEVLVEDTPPAHYMPSSKFTN